MSYLILCCWSLSVINNIDKFWFVSGWLWWGYTVNTYRMCAQERVLEGSENLLLLFLANK